MDYDIWVRIPLNLFLVDFGSTMGSIRSALNLGWTLDPVCDLVIIILRLEMEGPTSVSLCILLLRSIIFQTLPLAINIPFSFWVLVLA